MVFSKYTDLLPKEVLKDDVPELQKPDEEAVQEVKHFDDIYCNMYSFNAPSCPIFPDKVYSNFINCSV